MILIEIDSALVLFQNYYSFRPLSKKDKNTRITRNITEVCVQEILIVSNNIAQDRSTKRKDERKIMN